MSTSSPSSGIPSLLPARDHLRAGDKALRVNLDPDVYGTFAEIGAGQEVARWFFRVGGASGTIAKTMSAYDMTFSDAVYGACERYVSRQRLQTMLEREFGLLIERLDGQRGESTRFFVFADTVAASSYSRRHEGHGWLGVRFQDRPRDEASQIIIHVRLLDQENLSQQEALGLLGVNLVHGALHCYDDPEELILGLLDNLSGERVEIDMIRCDGPAFQDVDNRLLSLKLVQHGLSRAAMFTANGEVVQPSEVLYKKPILVERGSFRPATKVTLDMDRAALASFVQLPGVEPDQIVRLMEMTLHSLTDGDTIDHQDFLDRADILGALGMNVLISNYAEYHRLAQYFFQFTQKPIAIVMGVPTLRALFDESYYADLQGGILESFGRLFRNELRLLVYPEQEPATSSLITATNLRVAPHLRHLHAYLIENRMIEDLRDFDLSCLGIRSRDVLTLLQAGDPAWEPMVPEAVANLIKQRRMLGLTPSKAA